MKLIKTKLQNGMILWYRSDDKYIGQRIALGKYEEHESNLIVKQALRLAKLASAKGGQAGFVAVDVGANIGYYTLLLAKVCKRVYAFEPDKNCFEILIKNIKENKLTNVVAINKAVSDRKGKENFIVDKENLGNSRLIFNLPKSLFDKRDLIDCVRLDDLIIEKVDLIKIDVQGWEPRVIEGAKRIIEKYSPVMFLEFNGNNKMINFLKKYYKNIFTIDYWFYILKKGIKIDKKTGYADLFLTNENISWWERYKNLQWRKVIKKLLKYNQL